MFRLGMCAEGNGRNLRGFGYLVKVITEVKFKNGLEVTQINQEFA